MQLACPRCQTVLEFADIRPSFCSRCGYPLSGPAAAAPTLPFDPGATGPPPRAAGGEEPPPEVVGGYRLLRPLGAGGMGTVYEAEDTASGRRVALKLLAADYAGSADALERFRREGRLASTLAHPHCVFVLGADEEAGRPYIVMELMPGRTLEDLVAERGPLEPAAAVALILDVIDGLREAHRLGFIHRDVKPSNCFLDAEGRAKVGDFGLARSLAPGAHLTRTGSFLGTLLFAAPEQIKGEQVDAQTDVYAVAATLYYLLTGRAPFAGGDAAATLARTVSEPAPPMRGLRPQIDPALDAVVLRGLERDRGRRWRGLADLRAALAPFRPGRLRMAALGARFAAYFFDGLVLFVANALLTGLFVGVAGPPAGPPPVRMMAIRPQPPQLLGLALGFLYFALLEGVWGASLGKRLLGLRVGRASTPGRRPGLGRALLRTGVFYVLRDLGMVTFGAALFLYMPKDAGEVELAPTDPSYFFLSLAALGGMAVGLVALLAPMRARNGYRGLHEWLSDTRVVLLPRAKERRGLAGRAPDLPVVRPEGLPETLGPFVIRGALRWDARAKVLLGQDRSLGRAVWICLRPGAEAPLAAPRREISRATRLRWLACGRHEDWQWDAFMAFDGGPLRQCVQPGGESWAQVRQLLEQLADELAAAGSEGTLPGSLHPNRVWVGPEGQVQLLDIPVGEDVHAAEPGPRAALALLAEVAALALEGRPRPPGVRGPVRAPLPLHVAPALGRLLGAAQPYAEVAEFQADLKAGADRPDEVGRPRRAAHLALLGAFLCVGMGCWMLLAGWLTPVVSLGILLGSIEKKEQRLHDLEEGALLDFSVSAVNPDPGVRLRGLVQLDADYQLADRLRQRLADDQRRRDARIESLGWLSRQQVPQMAKQAAVQRGAMDKGSDHPLPHLLGQAAFRRNALRAAEPSPTRAEVEADLAGFAFGSLLAWQALWAAWAFLWRGGLTYRMMDIALVRADGRPASRLQCAWRALLVWAPVAGLLALSVWLDLRYWSAWEQGEAPGWLLALASASWYAALLLLAVWVVLALWRPARTLHDRLAGTYLVPR
jgi:hypothetical protein